MRKGSKMKSEKGVAMRFRVTKTSVISITAEDGVRGKIIELPKEPELMAQRLKVCLSCDFKVDPRLIDIRGSWICINGKGFKASGDEDTAKMLEEALNALGDKIRFSRPGAIVFEEKSPEYHGIQERLSFSEKKLLELENRIEGLEALANMPI